MFTFFCFCTWAQTNNSVLTNGTWYKIAVSETGVFKITSSDLINMGVNLNSINPKNIRIYGNGAGMLPEPNNQFRQDDLVENAIEVVGEDDNVFDLGDYILFYGQSPVVKVLKADNSGFEHKMNYYSDSTYYFLNTDIGPGKRIQENISLNDPPSHFANSFDELQYHEVDFVNLIKTGKLWLGECFDSVLTYNYSSHFPNLDTLSPVNILVSVAARSDVQSSFRIDANSQNILSPTIGPVFYSQTSTFAVRENSNADFNAYSDSIQITITYNKEGITSVGWLDYFELNARRKLIMYGNQMSFRDRLSKGIGNITKFTLSNPPAGTEIWDITNPLNVKKQATVAAANNLEFVTNTDTLKDFFVFDNVSFLTPQFIKVVANQNLHGLSCANLIIVTNPLFINEAQQLADHHISHDNISIAIVTTEQIYNEFSTGAQDISAIRDFIRLKYQTGQSTDDSLVNVLLLGDASYDYKNRVPNNSNFVPTFESVSSLQPTSSYATDDFFTLLDSLEGVESSGMMDIGIGRLPVRTQAEAQDVVNKIIHYTTNQICLKNWRTNLCFIADDGDANMHMTQSSYISNKIDTTNSCFNINKIYFDDYLEVQDTTGYSYPDANAAINHQFNEGNLFVNYIGHGNENELAHESVLTNSDLQNLTNFDKLPFFYAATANFGRYDNPGIISCGENLILNSLGGSIGAIVPVRLTYSQLNFNLFQNFMNNFFELNQNEEHFSIGELYRTAKNITGSTTEINKRCFSLLGDPAIKLSFPQHQVITSQINGVNSQYPLDTLTQGDAVSIEGSVADNNGNILNNFNGTIYYRLYDMMRNDTTLGNNGSNPFIFHRQDSILIEGSENVVNGAFQIQFIVPNYGQSGYGYPKISFYASNNITDAMGCFEDVVMQFNQTGIFENLDNNLQAKIYPTITSDNLFVQFGSQQTKEIKVTITDLTGRLVYNRYMGNIEDSEFTIDVTGMENGLYIIRVSSNNSYQSQKFIKE